MKTALLFLFPLIAAAQITTFPNASSSGNATTINGASVPASQSCLGSNSSSQLIPCGGVGPFLATGQTGATPATPAAGNTSLFFPTAGGPGGVDASGNVYAMPSVNILSLAANSFWAGPTSGIAAAPTARAIVGADLPLPSASTLGGIQSRAAVTNQWIKSISTAGVVATTQPDFSDLSGTAAASQLPNPSASTLGGVQSKAAVANQWINTISTAGVPGSTQPASTNLSDAATLAYLANSQTFTGVNTFSQAGGTATPAINLTGSAASGSLFRAGSFEVQPVAGLNNGFISDNIYWNGTNFISRGNGWGEMLYFITGETQFRFSPVTSPGSSITPSTSFKVNQNGSAGMGGPISGAAANFAGSAIFTNGTATALGTLTIGTNVGLENAVGHYGSRGTAPVVAGAGCAASGTINDNAGAIVLTAGATSCTITFNKAFNVPIPSLTGSSVLITPVVTSITTTVLTIAVAAASGTVYYTVQDVN